jgi:hypothetical protein
MPSYFTAKIIRGFPPYVSRQIMDISKYAIAASCQLTHRNLRSSESNIKQTKEQKSLWIPLFTSR